MNKMKKTVLILSAILMVFASCSREEGNLFDKTAAERLIEQREKAITYLTDAPNGWEMRYFPTPDAAGYVLICHFDKNGSVVVSAKNPISSNDAYKVDTSLWDIDYTQSVTLTFNSYNDILHIFSDPLSDGIGYNGDYEFVIMNSTPNYFYLKSKKRSAYIDMFKMNETENWEHYFELIDNFNAMTFTGNDEAEFTYIGYDTILTMTYNEGTLTYTRNNADTVLGFVVTPGAMHFYNQSPTASGISAKDFVLNEDTSKLVCTADPAVYFVSEYSAADYFNFKFNKGAIWSYRPDGTDATTNAAIETIKAAAEANGAKIHNINYARRRVNNNDYSYLLLVNYSVEGKLFQGYLNLRYSNVANRIRFTYRSADKSIEPLLLRLGSTVADGAALFSDIFCDTFTAESYSGSQLNMVEMALTSTTDPTKVIKFVADIKSL